MHQMLQKTSDTSTTAYLHKQNIEKQHSGMQKRILFEHHLNLYVTDIKPTESMTERISVIIMSVLFKLLLSYAFVSL